MSGSSHHGQFLPGNKVADRYRIVSLVGRGGMGEVYRADDLKLGHTVALKFLPVTLANDSGRLEYFHSEVRLTRQISHPNVCRVYDIGEYDGQHFLSMEYIDGEDLRVLLRRIGKLPHAKSVQIARQLCAGLAAAHDRSVLHRDLKPANIMLDSRGQVRITDFGLARLIEQDTPREIAGTPAYMAPEQLTRGETTIQSDLFALGLILTEIFTGKAVLKPGSIPDLVRSHEESLPQSVTFTDDIDPDVQRVIRRCLEREAYERPASARAVALGLPGGDPIEAALAAGETPSPEMVATSGETGQLSLRSAGFCLAILLVGLASLVPIMGKSSPTKGLDKDPAGYAALVQASLQALNLYAPNAYRDWGFLRVGDRVPKSMGFWYRQSPDRLVPLADPQKLGLVHGNTLVNPPPLFPGMVSVRLHTDGSLRELLVIPSMQTPEEQGPDFDTLLRLLTKADPQLKGATLIEEQFDEVRRSDWVPPGYADKAWSLIPKYPTSIERVNIAELNGKIVFFHVVDDTSAVARTFSSIEIEKPKLGPIVTILITLAAVVMGWKNVFAGRSDLRGARWLALFMLGFDWTELALGSVLTPSVLMAGLILAIATSARAWLYYVALEPLARRFWPDMLVTWSRGLAGRIQDPRIGRDILYGTMVGILFTLCAFGLLNVPANANPQTLCGTRYLISQLAKGLGYSIGYSLLIAMAMVMVMVRALFRNKWLPIMTAAAFCVAWHPELFEPLWNSEGKLDVTNLDATELAAIVAFSGYYAVIAVMLARWGIVAVASFMLCHDFFRSFPWSADLAGPDLSGCIFAIAGIVICGLYGFYVSVGGRAGFVAR